MSVYALRVSIIFLVIAAANLIVLVWSGFQNVVAWKSLATIAVIFCACTTVFTVLSRSRGDSDSTARPNPRARSRNVKYVLDRGLVRFVKVAGTFLAFFIASGAILVGFDMKQAVKECADSEKASHDLLEEVRKATAQTQKLNQETAKISKALRRKADDAMKGIDTKVSEATSAAKQFQNEYEKLGG
jgi:hypothetical protein